MNDAPWPHWITYPLGMLATFVAGLILRAIPVVRAERRKDIEQLWERLDIVEEKHNGCREENRELRNKVEILERRDRKEVAEIAELKQKVAALQNQSRP